LLLRAGPDVLRFAPSLVIPEADLEEGLVRLERAIEEVVGAGTDAARPATTAAR
jgi:acetylornithine/N-succinyldiaminopimelate aminotransferase